MRIQMVVRQVTGLAATLALASTSAIAKESNDAEAVQKFVTAATIACTLVETVKEPPVRCWLDYDDIKPVLVVSFDGSDKANRYAPLVVGLVGRQLCAAVRADQNGAALALVDTRTNRASVYSCEKRAFTHWVKLNTPPED